MIKKQDISTIYDCLTFYINLKVQGCESVPILRKTTMFHFFWQRLQSIFIIISV